MYVLASAVALIAFPLVPGGLLVVAALIASGLGMSTLLLHLLPW